MKTLELTSYDQQALDFLATTGAKIEITFSHNGKHFEDDKEERDIYNVILSRGNRKYKFAFGNSLNDSGFYAKINRNKYSIDRKYINDRNLVHIIKRLYNWGFNPSIDTIHRPVAPSEYSILCCLTKHNPETFENFCSDFGYDTDSRKAKKTFKAVSKEWLSVSSLFSYEELEVLREIQ